MLIYPSDFISCTCTIEDRFAPMAFHAVLSNGKRLVAFVQKRESGLLPLLKRGDVVQVTINPADFDRARIRAIVQA